MAILVIGGPTATGKSRLALDLAKQTDAVIVSADAMTIYRDLDIGTAKPTMAEREGVPHFCIDIRDYDEPYTVGDFVLQTRQIIEKYPNLIIAGGTPYYLNALFRPLAPLPESKPEVRQRLETLEFPYQHLQQIDPVSANRLHPNDKVRVIRALEVYELTGRPLSEVQNDPPRHPPIDAEIVWIDREDLRPRIGQRIDQMLKQGYLDECQQILNRKWDLSAKPLQSFSYKFLLKHLDGELDLDEAIERTEIGTWHLARKQRTWARNIGWQSCTPEQGRKRALVWASAL